MSGPHPDDWSPATSEPGELYTPAGQSRARWSFFSGLKNKDPRNRRYRRSMNRMAMFFLGIALVLVVLLIVAALIAS